MRRTTKAGSAAPAGYSGTPLPQKLGIKPGHAVRLVAAPPSFAKTLGVLPEGANLRTGARGAADLAIWFVRSGKELAAGVAKQAAAAPAGGLWIAWPKLTSTLASDLREGAVRDAALAEGLVDYKVCAIDAEWSGLKFAKRR
jgi:hypothetical protein